MSRLPLLSWLDLSNVAPDHLKQFVAKRRDDYLTPVFLATYLLDQRCKGNMFTLLLLLDKFLEYLFNDSNCVSGRFFLQKYCSRRNFEIFVQVIFSKSLTKWFFRGFLCKWFSTKFSIFRLTSFPSFSVC